jgi:hypothetical protein
VRWDRLNRAFAPLADATIDVFTDETISFAKHPWGKFPVHYELDYHAAFLSRLTAIALDDARTEAQLAQAAQGAGSWFSHGPFRRRRKALLDRDVAVPGLGDVPGRPAHGGVQPGGAGR